MENHKHDINDAVCGFMKLKKGKPLKILETHQEKGNATERYSTCGCVVSFEAKRETYEGTSRRFSQAYSLDACINNLNGLCETASIGSARFPIIMPPKPIDAVVGIDSLKAHGCKFDIIDVDPYGSPKAFIPGVLSLFEDVSFLFVTTGEMYNVRYRAHQTMSQYNLQADDSLKPVRSFFKQDNALVLGGWLIQTALKNGVALFPIFIYDYWTGFSGVQRIGFYVKPRASPKDRAIALQQLGNDLLLGVKIIKCAYEISSDLAWRFSEYDDKYFRQFVGKRIGVLEKQLKR